MSLIRVRRKRTSSGKLLALLVLVLAVMWFLGRI